MDFNFGFDSVFFAPKISFTFAWTSSYSEPNACFLASPFPYFPAITSFAKSTIDFVS